MDVTEILENLAALMDADIPINAREQFASELQGLVLRENRQRAEEQGIGMDSQLSPKVLYSVQELLESDPTLPPAEEWFTQYGRSLLEVLQALERK